MHCPVELRQPSEERKREWLCWREHVRRELTLQPHHVVPRAQLVADTMVNADRTKSERLVKADARRIGKRDSRVRITKLLQREDGEQRRIQGATNSTSLPLGMHVRRYLDGPLICRTRAMRSRVRVAGNLTHVDVDDPGGARERRLYSSRHLRAVRRLELEGGCAIDDRGGVDLRERCSIRWSGEPNAPRHGGRSLMYSRAQSRMIEAASSSGR